MKRQLSLVVSLLVLVAMVFTVVSCDLVPDAGKKHEHTFSDKWSYDATNHWHAATCDDNDACKSEKADVAAHTLSGDTCSVCGYKKPAEPKPEQPKPEQPKADGSKEKPFAITVPGTAKVSVPADGVVYYTFTLAEDKTLKISFDSANVSVACAASVDQITADSFYNVGDVKVLETDLVAGTYYVAFATANFAAEEYNVTAELFDIAEKVIATPESIAGTYYIRAGAVMAETVTVVVGADGVITFGETAYNYTLADNVATVTINGNDVSSMVNIMINDEGKVTGFIYNTYEYPLVSAPSEGGDEEEEGALSGTYVDADGVLSVAFSGNTVTFTHTHPLSGFVNTLTFKYTVADGVVTLTNEDDSAAPAMYGITLTNGVPTAATYEGFEFEISAGTAGGGDEEEGGGTGSEPIEITTEGYLLDGESEVTITDAQYTAGKVYYAFTPWNEGEYYFTSNDLYISGVYLNGVALTTNDNGYYVLSQNVQYAVEISCEYINGAGTYTVNADFQYPLGHQENPNWIWSDSFGTEITANYPGNYQPVWYQFYASANGTVTVTAANSTATILITTSFGYEIESVDGTVSLNVVKGMKYYIGVADYTLDENYANLASEITFTPTFTEGDYVGDGTINTPNIAVDGNNTANVPEYNNVYFVYTATANGTLTLTTESTNCTWYVTTDSSKWEFVNTQTLSIDLYTDQIAYICVSTADYAAADIVFNASFKAEPTEEYFQGDLVIDGSAANEVVIADNTSVILSTWTGGSYVITWDNADAIVIDPYTETVIANGDTISGEYGFTLKVYLPEYAAGTVNVTIAPYVEEVVVGSGTVADPYELKAENTLDFAGGYDSVFYAYTAEKAGTLTITRTCTDFYLVQVKNGSSSNIGNVPSFSFTLVAGQTIIIGAGTDSGKADTVTFTSSFVVDESAVVPEADGSFDNPYALEADNTCAFPGGYDYVFYKYTAEAAGTLTVTMTSADFYWGYGAGQFALNNVGNATTSADIVLAAGETVYIGISTNSADAATVTFTSSFVEGSGEVEEEEQPLVLVLGSNSVVVSADDASLGFKEGTFTATVNGTYTFESNDVGVRIYDGDTMVGTGVVELEAGKTYTAVVLAMAEGSYTVNVTVEEKVVIPELEIGATTQYNAVEKTYSYTATADGVLTLTTGGAIMSGVTFTYTVNDGTPIEVALAAGDAAVTTELTLVAGDVVTVNISGSGYSSITASFSTPSASPTEVAGVINVGDNTYTLEANTYVVIPLAVDGTFVLTWDGAVVEYKASADADYVAITSGAEASLTADGGASLKVYLADYAAGTVTLNVAVKGAESEGGDAGETATPNGEYTAEAANGSSVKLTVTDATATSGTVVIWRRSSYGGESTYACAYTVADGVGTLVDTGNGVPYGGTLTVAADGTILTYTYSGTTYQLVKA